VCGEAWCVERCGAYYGDSRAAGAPIPSPGCRLDPSGISCMVGCAGIRGQASGLNLHPLRPSASAQGDQQRICYNSPLYATACYCLLSLICILPLSLESCPRPATLLALPQSRRITTITDILPRSFCLLVWNTSSSSPRPPSPASTSFRPASFSSLGHRLRKPIMSGLRLPSRPVLRAMLTVAQAPHHLLHLGRQPTGPATRSPKLHLHTGSEGPHFVRASADALGVAAHLLQRPSALGCNAHARSLQHEG